MNGLDNIKRRGMEGSLISKFEPQGIFLIQRACHGSKMEQQVKDSKAAV